MTRGQVLDGRKIDPNVGSGVSWRNLERLERASREAVRWRATPGFQLLIWAIRGYRPAPLARPNARLNRAAEAQRLGNINGRSILHGSP
jgi:hypothetical protein